MIKLTICLCLSMLLHGLSTASDTPELLFLLGGQSNMEGHGYPADLPADAKSYRSAPKNVSIWNDKEQKWQALELGRKFGPEIGFAHTLAKAWPDQHIGLVKYAAGGTSMDQWKPAGKLYQRLLGSYQKAQASAPNAQLAAVIWHQGESDSDSLEVANAYQAKLIKHINSLRKDTNQPDLLFIYGQINPAKSFRGQPRFLYAEVVRQAQADLQLENAHMIQTDDCEKNLYLAGKAGTTEKKKIEKNEDDIHYSANGQILMGQRFAETFLQKYTAEQK
ncbi:sialate O-acetylesterase [Persicirhabdus sediminis]|uniref:Sialate O-acetylesterase domain-containing protein n=1 Tax=Persicirhabdus sediminis TaxID=454144 RepID=A0A8J7MGQ2_9BACT|nr:sialate O-acetylesterase [Persicirhabdus sediminis]MBK1792488.1 hypothetical protein [Persicirhabdus sediminis]